MKQYQSREEVPLQEKWNLDDIYPDLKSWEKDYITVEGLAVKLSHFDGAINNGGALFSFLKTREELSYKLNHLHAYSMLKSDEDTRNTEAQALKERVQSLGVKISSATSFFMPFLLSQEEGTLKRFIEEDSGLKYFEEDLWDSFRYKEHVLGKSEEALLSQLGESLSAPSEIFGMINNADIRFGEVTGEEGKKVELTRGMYAKLIEDDNRDIRREAYKAYYQPYIQNKNTIAATLSAAVKSNARMAKIRSYPSALEKSLFSDNVPRQVYENLIESTKENIAPMHRYIAIRKEKLGLDELRAYDLSVPIVKGVKIEIPYEEAFETMLKGLAPLGKEYIGILEEFRAKRYLDVRETPGKRSGAYNLGIYGVHPYILLNHRDDLDSLFTLVHECGHGVHSTLSGRHQPQISARYSIFVAEVASTVNEILMIHYLLNNEKDTEVKRHLLNHFIDQYKGTFFTQVMFAEFELKTHELAEKGEPLNVEVFNSLYEDLFREYNGSEIVFDEEVKYGWSRIPHFYRPFYVYKYATGYASAIHLANRILKGDKETIAAYHEFLQSGSSDYPLELLKKTGVDLTTAEPINSALAQFTELVEEFSKA
ncbi:oligoendopeptidase F [Bacillus massilinigeriensis]|uniref:oligoendopeptidase F n=1 Tax=Bacillus mediterraneensis TaxID=1805474 RepID=UPI0008F8864C|nr:oligoendopeptidase F [Bacillus mediterraneensis]